MVRVRSKAHSQEFMNAFRPVRNFLAGIGQLPFRVQKRVDGTYAFRFKTKSWQTVLFAFVSIIFCVCYLVSSFGLVMLFFEVDIWGNTTYTINVTKRGVPTLMPNQTFVVGWEAVMVSNNKGIVIVSHSMLTMTFVGIFFIVLNQSQYVHYFNYWNKVVQAVHMNPSEGVQRHLRVRIIVSILYVILESAVFWLMYGLRTISGVYACLLLKFIWKLPAESWFVFAQVLGFLFIVYGHLGARAIIIQFIFFCLILKNVASQWNQRLRNTLKKSREPSMTTEHRRHEFRCLLKDHLVIVQLFKMTESTFSTILTTFFSTQLICLIVEAFTLWKLFMATEAKTDVFTTTNVKSYVKPRPIPPRNWTEDNEFRRMVDFYDGTLTLFLFPASGLAIYSVTSFAHKAYMEAMVGFQIIRRRGLMDCPRSERNFMYSMIVSFARNNPLIVSANGYFLLNRAFIVSILASVASYFVITIQFDFTKYVVKKADYRMEWGPA